MPCFRYSDQLPPEGSHQKRGAQTFKPAGTIEALIVFNVLGFVVKVIALGWFN